MDKFILHPEATGDVHTSPLLKKTGAKTKFELSKPDTLDQEDLQFLFENGHSNMIIKVQAAVPTPVKKETKDTAE